MVANTNSLVVALVLAVAACVDGQSSSAFEELFAKSQVKLNDDEIFGKLQEAAKQLSSADRDADEKTQDKLNLVEKLISVHNVGGVSCEHEGAVLDSYETLADEVAKYSIGTTGDELQFVNAYNYVRSHQVQHYKLCAYRIEYSVSVANSYIGFRQLESLHLLRELVHSSSGATCFERFAKGSLDFMIRRLEDPPVAPNKGRFRLWKSQSSLTSPKGRADFERIYKILVINRCQLLSEQLDYALAMYGSTTNETFISLIDNDIKIWLDFANDCKDVSNSAESYTARAFEEMLSRLPRRKKFGLF